MTVYKSADIILRMSNLNSKTGRLQISINNPHLWSRFDRAAKRRGLKTASRAMRELAVERLIQIETSGDPAVIQTKGVVNAAS